MPIERNNSFHLLLSDDELKLLRLLAEREGLNASDYLRTLIRTMPSTSSPSPVHLMRLGATLGSLSRSGEIDLSKIFEANMPGLAPAKPRLEESKKKKTK